MHVKAYLSAHEGGFIETIVYKIYSTICKMCSNLWHFGLQDNNSHGFWCHCASKLSHRMVCLQYGSMQAASVYCVVYKTSRVKDLLLPLLLLLQVAFALWCRIWQVTYMSWVVYKTVLQYLSVQSTAFMVIYMSSTSDNLRMNGFTRILLWPT